MGFPSEKIYSSPPSLMKLVPAAKPIQLLENRTAEETSLPETVAGYTCFRRVTFFRWPALAATASFSFDT